MPGLLERTRHSTRHLLGYCSGDNSTRLAGSCWEQSEFPEQCPAVSQAQSDSSVSVKLWQDRWWLTVNLSEPRGAQIFAQTLFWVSLWGCFWMRLRFKSADWVTQIPLHPIHGRSERIQEAEPPASKTEFLPPDCPPADISSFPSCLWTETETLALPWMASLWICGLELHH